MCSSVYEIEGPEEIKDCHFQISAVCVMPPCTWVLKYQLALKDVLPPSSAQLWDYFKSNSATWSRFAQIER